MGHLITNLLQKYKVHLLAQHLKTSPKKKLFRCPDKTKEETIYNQPTFKDKDIFITVQLLNWLLP